MTPKIDCVTVSPEASLELLSPSEVDQLVRRTDPNLFRIFRRCALAVLNTGNINDNTAEILEEYKDFDIRFIRQSRGIKLQLLHAPASAFVAVWCSVAMARPCSPRKTRATTSRESSAWVAAPWCDLPVSRAP